MILDLRSAQRVRKAALLRLFDRLWILLQDAGDVIADRCAACLTSKRLLVLEIVIRLVGEPGDDRCRDQAEQNQGGRDFLT